MVKRKIVQIDETRCTGCGLCMPACPEGAIQIIDGKARLVSEVYCDGLGACLGECPEDAIRIIEREAKEFDEEAVKEYLKEIEKGPLPDEPAFCACPGSMARQWRNGQAPPGHAASGTPLKSELRQWPVQLMLINPDASYFQDSDLAIVADCVPFAYADFHHDFVRGKSLVVGCPKLDDIGYYEEKLTELFRTNTIRSITVASMEVPCCSGLVQAVRQAVAASGKDIPMEKVVIGIKGERKAEAVAM